MQYAATKNLPENVDLMVLDASGTLREDVALEELPEFLADEARLSGATSTASRVGRTDPMAGYCVKSSVSML